MDHKHVGCLFTAYAETEDSRECISGDLGKIKPAELRRQFAQAESFYRDFLSVAEHLGYAVYILAREAIERHVS